LRPDTKHIPVENALEHVAGYAVMNDVSARDLQLQTSQWTAGKTLDTFAPFGPGIVPRSLIPDPQNLWIETRINGRTVQNDSTLFGERDAHDGVVAGQVGPPGHEGNAESAGDEGGAEIPFVGVVGDAGGEAGAGAGQQYELVVGGAECASDPGVPRCLGQCDARAAAVTVPCRATARRTVSRRSIMYKRYTITCLFLR
jgi:hypothetical protein